MSIPRRPEVPGAPGFPLPDPESSRGSALRVPGGTAPPPSGTVRSSDGTPRAPGGTLRPPDSAMPPSGSGRPQSVPQSVRGVHGAHEVQARILNEDDEPTKPNLPRRSLTIPDLARADAAQLAGIVAAWEKSDSGDRVLLAEFARRLASIPKK